jgi:hypothetical protein
MIWSSRLPKPSGGTATLTLTGNRRSASRTPCCAALTIASAFVARWCAAQRIEILDGVYRVRDDEPKSRVGAGLHKTP